MLKTALHVNITGVLSWAVALASFARFLCVDMVRRCYPLQENFFLMKLLNIVDYFVADC